MLHPMFHVITLVCLTTPLIAKTKHSNTWLGELILNWVKLQERQHNTHVGTAGGAARSLTVICALLC